MKILIVDDQPELAYCTGDYLVKDGISMGDILVIRTSSDDVSYEEAQGEVFKHYELDSGCIVLMDYNLGSNFREKNGGTFIQDLIKKGMPLENFIAISSSFGQKVPGLYGDFNLRGGDMSEETRKRLGLSTEESKLPKVSPEPPNPELPNMLV